MVSKLVQIAYFSGNIKIKANVIKTKFGITLMSHPTYVYHSPRKIVKRRNDYSISEYSTGMMVARGIERKELPDYIEYWSEEEQVEQIKKALQSKKHLEVIND